MNDIAKAMTVIFAILFMSGIGNAVCGSCTYPATGQSAVSWVEGTQVQLQGPVDSGTQDRPLNYLWALWKCNADGSSTAATFNFVSGGASSRDLRFYAPPEGSYRITLTVIDQNAAVATRCYDIKDLCFSTTPGECPTLCCGEVCKEDPPTTSCPYRMVYTPSQGVVPGWEYRWYIDSPLLSPTHKLIETDMYPGPIQVDIPWNTYAVGDYVLSFEIWAPPATGGAPIQQQVCAGSPLCSLCGGVPALTPCTVRVVEKPSADITGF